MSARRGRGNRTPAGKGDAAFWGEARAVTDDGDAAGEPVRSVVRPTPDPGAMPRSLGDPPLSPGNPGHAQRHLAIVYEEAVRTATALAAANGLLDPEE